MQPPSNRSVALLAFTAVAVYLCWLMVEPFFQVLVWAAVLAIVSYPVHARLMRWGRGPATSAVLTTVVVVLTVLVPLLLVGIMLVHEVTAAVPHLQTGLAKLLDPNAPLRQWLDRHVDAGPFLDQEFLVEKMKSFSASVASEVLTVVGDLFGTAIQGFFVLFTLYYLLRDADRIVRAMRGFLPLDDAQCDRMLGQTREVISASLQGVLMIAALQGALGGLAFWVLRLPSPLLWGVIMFFLSMIPMTGAFIVWGPAVIYLFASGHSAKAICLTLWGVLVIGMVDNFLRPRLVGQKTRLHELVVLFSVLGGLKVFGVLGIVVGPVVVAITLGLVGVLREANSPQKTDDAKVAHT